MWENSISFVIFDTYDVIFNWSISLLPPIVLDNLFGKANVYNKPFWDLYNFSDLLLKDIKNKVMKSCFNFLVSSIMCLYPWSLTFSD